VTHGHCLLFTLIISTFCSVIYDEKSIYRDVDYIIMCSLYDCYIVNPRIGYKPYLEYKPEPDLTVVSRGLSSIQRFTILSTVPPSALPRSLNQT